MTERLPDGNDFGSEGHLTEEQLAILADPRLAEIAEVESAAGAEPAADQTSTPAHAAQREHLALCAPCRAAFEATERALQALRDPAALHEPPAELWDRIAAEIAAAPTDELRRRARGRSSGWTGDRTAERTTDRTTDRPGDPPGDRTRHRGGRRNPRRVPAWVPLAAAAAGAVLGGAAVAAVLGQDTTEVEPPVAVPTVVGDATLEPVAAEDFTGRAEMVETAAGELELTVEISAAPDPEAGYFEVWLRDEAGSQLISLGSATGGSTTFTVPEGIDLSQYPVVDVSHEHFDGDPTHSGTTLAEGPMEDPDS